MWRKKIPITVNVLQLLVSNKSMSSGITSLSWPCWSRRPVVTTVASPGSCWGYHHRPALAPVTHWLAPALPPSLSEPEPVSPLSPLSPLSALAPDIPFNSGSGARHQAQNTHTSKPQRGEIEDSLPEKISLSTAYIVQRRFLELCFCHNFRQRYFTLYFTKIIHWLPRSVPV